MSISLEQLQAMLAKGEIDQGVFDQLAAVARASVRAAASGAADASSVTNNVTVTYHSRPGTTLHAPTLRTTYLARVYHDENILPSFARLARNKPVHLAGIFTGLWAVAAGVHKDRAMSKAGSVGRLLDGLDLWDDPHESVVELVNAHQWLVLHSGPGSGKSAFTSYLALCLAGEALGKADANRARLTAPLLAPKERRPRREEQLARPQSWDLGTLLPVRIVLREFAATLPVDDVSVAAIDADTLWRHIEQRLDAR